MLRVYGIKEEDDVAEYARVRAAYSHRRIELSCSLKLHKAAVQEAGRAVDKRFEGYFVTGEQGFLPGPYNMPETRDLGADVCELLVRIAPLMTIDSAEPD
jgi:hypothetical protein